MSAMPEQIFVVGNIEEALNFLEDDTLDTKLSRYLHYHTIQNALDTGGTVSTLTMERILAICIHDLKTRKKYSFKALNLVSAITRKVKAGECSSVPNLLISALVIFDTLKASALQPSAEPLHILCFETLISYPDETLIELANRKNSDLIEMFVSYMQPVLSIDTRMKAINTLFEYLKILPPDNRSLFIWNHISVWFSKLIPTVFSFKEILNSTNTVPLDLLDLLTEDLVKVDYTDSVAWKYLLDSISNPKKFPLILMSLLESGSDIWHRFWIVFIKLLKKHSTLPNKYGSPVNCLLPVLEMAFKKDVANRCRSFKCWNALIDNLSAETNELDLNKKIKLLLVPLRTNNAKVEETVLAKLETWWHLIRQFHTKIEKQADNVLIPFLFFCLGKCTVENQVLFPGQLTENTKNRCAEAFVEIVGHVNCDGCVSLPKLNEKLISTKLIVDYWNDWLYWVKTAIKILTSQEIERLKQIRCIWKSFITTIAELPDNKIRADLFDDVMKMLEEFVKDSQSDSKLVSIIFNVLLKSLVEDTKIYCLLKTRNAQGNYIQNMISIILKPSMYTFYSSSNIDDSLNNLKPFMSIILNKSLNSPNDSIQWLLENLSSNNNCLMVWTALADVVIETEYNLSAHIICCMLIWPLKSMDSFTNEKKSAEIWFNLYNLFYPKISKNKIDKEISKILLVNDTYSPVANYFKLYSLLGVLKHGLVHKSAKGFEKEVEILLKVACNIKESQDIENIMPSLVDTLVLMLNYVTRSVNVTFATHTIKIIKHVIKIVVQSLERKNNDENQIFTCVKNLLKHISELIGIESYSNLKVLIVDELIECLSYFKTYSGLKNLVDNTLKSLLLKIKEDDPLHEKLKMFAETFDKDNKPTTAIYIIQDSDKNNFTPPKSTNITPKRTNITKKLKRNETGIVTTVEEDGEEYLVVPSKWKFNPKHLTEKQKEKLQKKREDIPALYQDLSQSQDEFKLTSWKTDSQDTTSTSSKSASKSENENISSILKSIPSSNVVPKIMENILSENTKNEIQDNVKDNTDISNIDKLDEQSPATKSTRTSRMALKDRVFQNVRNLIEKSTVQKISKDIPITSNQFIDKNDLKTSPIKQHNEIVERLSENLNQTLFNSVPKTPTTKQKHVSNLINSAPPKLVTERPSRVKRKPKRLEDSEIFALKKRRHLSSQSESQSDFDLSDTSGENIQTDQFLNIKEICPESENNTQKSEKYENVNVSSAEVIDTNICDTKTIEHNQTKSNNENSKDKSQMNINNEQKDKDNNITTFETELAIIEHNSVKEKELKVQEIEVSAVDNNITPKLSSEVSTPSNKTLKDKNIQKLPSKKNVSKKSRIEKNLQIDMVEGHPYLKTQTEKRMTRKFMTVAENTRRKSVIEKLTKNKVEPKITAKTKKKFKLVKDKKENKIVKKSSNSIKDSQNKISNSEYSKPSTKDSQIKFSTSEDLPSSEDVIESSQDSNVTTISVKSTKKKLPLIIINKLPENSKILNSCLLKDSNEVSNVLSNVSPKNEEDDSLLSRNKTLIVDNQLKEKNDTQCINIVHCSTDEVMVIDDDEKINLNISDEMETDTQETANADTESMNTIMLDDITISTEEPSVKLNTSAEANAIKNMMKNQTHETSLITKTHTEQIHLTLTDQDNGSVSSPLKGEIQKKKDFLNDTLEISPIKTMSPLIEKKSPSPESSPDYVVITLSSPVQSNGEPIDKCDSPEIFTEEKMSPDKLEMSPPRQNASVTNTSPNTSLSLKKNKPQMRSGGRAAHMLGLCVPDKFQSIITCSEKITESEESKSKTIPINFSTRRNLRMLYNSTGENNDNAEKNKESGSLFKLQKNLPLNSSSPANSILKRKLVEIVDDATVSPASKRKRVSFHEPPVSTTIAVEKYIEPYCARSPQISKQKRQENEIRLYTNMKSPKRLDNLFKLDTILTRTVESFADVDISINNTNDTDMSASDQTPAVEIIKICELNDIDPICPDLVGCKDPINKIATELSSAAMSSLLMKELEGKVETVGDLAKLTELEVNRLCIKAPKVKVAKKVLTDYANRRAPKTQMNDKIVKPTEVKRCDVEVQTNDFIINDSIVQTDTVLVTSIKTQTDVISTPHTGTQTEESGSRSTADIIKVCLSERPDFVNQLGVQLENLSRVNIANTLPFNTLIDLSLNKMTISVMKTIINRVLDRQNELNSSSDETEDNALSFLQDFMCDRFDSKDLLSFCIQLLQKVRDKPS